VEIALAARNSNRRVCDPRRAPEHEAAIQIHRIDSRTLFDWVQCSLYCKPLIKLRPNKLNAVSAGGIAGFLAGVIGTGGAIRGLALAAFDLEKGVFVGTSAAIDSGVDFSRMIVYLRGNFPLPAFYWYIPGLLVRLCRLVSGEDCVEQIGPEKLPPNRPAVYLSHRFNDTWENSEATPVIESKSRGQRPRLQKDANQCRAAPVPLGFQHEKAGFAAAGGNVNNRRAR
jgi:hypothetical protein